jgi:hypothetical protein
VVDVGLLTDSLAALVDMPSCCGIRRSEDCDPFFHNVFFPLSIRERSAAAAGTLKLMSWQNQAMPLSAKYLPFVHFRYFDGQNRNATLDFRLKRNANFPR